MWQIDNRTPFATGQSWVRDLNGAETWLVVVKATFDIKTDGSVQVAKEQPSVTRSPIYRGEPGKSGIIYENDFVLAKPVTDIIANATAHAPNGKPVTQLDVGIRVGEVKKLLRVFGDRHWQSAGLTMSNPTAFVEMPIIYERAFGGTAPNASLGSADWYWSNPVGCGYALSRTQLNDVIIPNIEYPIALIRNWDDRPHPAGFGFIASNWQQRSILSGTYDQHWSDTRQPLLPHDFDMHFYQAAANDQQSNIVLTGGEPVVLLNLSPLGTIQFFLPKVELELETRFNDGERRLHPSPNLHTVILEPDLMRVSMIWHSAMECHAKVYKLDHTKIQLCSLKNAEEDEEIGDLLALE